MIKMIKGFCNLIGQKTELVTPNQNCFLQRLPSLDEYLHAKNVRRRLILSRDTDDQRCRNLIGWEHFGAITEELVQLSQHQINIVIHDFYGKIRHINELNFWEKRKNTFFEAFLGFFPKLIFFKKIGFFSFSPLRHSNFM